jgi:N-acetylmuramoyl-L-alanine amidase
MSLERPECDTDEPETIIVIDPGHGGDDPGAIGIDDLRECDVTLVVSRRIAMLVPLLTSRNVTPVLTHGGEGKSLSARCRSANDIDAALFVSIHCNAFADSNAHGFECFTSRGDTGADVVASRVYEDVSLAFPNLKLRTDWTDGDIDKEAGYYVLKHTRMRAVLIELGFITNSADHALLTNPSLMHLLSRAISRAIVRSL